MACLARVGSLRDFERFLRACAARCAQTLNKSDLGRDVGVSATTAREWIGALWENHVVTQWLRWRHWLHPEAMLWYWRDSGGNEVDLLVEWGQRLYAIERK